NGNAGLVVNGVNASVKWNNVTFNGNRGFNGWSWDGISVTGANGTVIGNNVTGNSRSGISVNGANALVFLNYLVQNGGYGIGVTGANATVINNTVVDNGNAGIVITSGDNSTVSNNTVTNNGNRGFNGWNYDGIYVRGNSIQILQNSIIQNNWHGINAVGLNLNISGNNVTRNAKDGINLNGANATVIGNNVTNNTGTGVYVTGTGVIVSNNTVKNNQYGIYFYNSYGVIRSNDLIGNQYGVYLSNSNATINFNRIIGNSKYGLYNSGNGIINATNNWWGSNNGPIVSSIMPSDIYVVGGNVTYNSWLVLNITASPPSTNNSSTITADVTHNNVGEDTSSQGNIPDNIPITFVTNIGTINSTSYTRSGKANVIFNHGTSIVGLANIIATLNNQTVITNVTKPLTVAVSQVGGSYNTTKNVTLTLIEPNCNSTIYYTLDGSDPRVTGIVYSNSIIINTTTTLRYVAADPIMNWGPEYNQTYVIDNIPPIVNVNIHGGVYNTTQIVNLTVLDNLDQNPIIYYTTNGSDPTISSQVYTGPITLQMNFTTRNIFNLKFMAVDSLCNPALIQSETYILTLPVVNTRNNNTYSLIQNAVDANSTMGGDVIEIYSGTYVETVMVNKKLSIKSVFGNNVTIGSSDPNGNIFTINNNGSDSVIQGLNINCNIILNANNCTIYQNNIIGNGTHGIITSNSYNNTILYNTITCNGFNGIQSNFSSNNIYGNTISGCESGIYSENSNNSIVSNILINNNYGIWTNNSTDTIHFNRITQNTYGLRNDMGTVNATNNWWGTNNPGSNDLWLVSGNVTYDPWLVLNLIPSNTNSGGNASVTADLTQDNHGESTLSQGFIPDGTMVNFNSNFGTILNTAYTIRGQAVTILNLNSTQAQNVTVSASLDNQSVSATGLISTGFAVLNVNSTAIDNATGLTLNTTYTIPLNNSVTWLSVLWINNGLFSEELQIIVDGTVVQNKYFYNAAYTTWNSTYSPSVFAAIVDANKNLPFVSDTTSFWNNITTTYNLTSVELTFVQNHRQEFIDNLTVNMVYNGVSGLNLTVTDPNNTTNVVNLTFPGNVINRSSQVIYQGSPYEGVKSFAIATTDVTNDVLGYWLDQYSNYQNSSVMSNVHGTFLTALMVEYLHDQNANNMANQYNVTWSRTSPIIVSVGESAYETYLTLECDHSMGMTVVGTLENIIGFNYECSYAISLMEYAIMNSAYGNASYQSYSTNGAFGSVTMNLFYASLNNNTESFLKDNFIIVKSIYDNNDFMVIDLETGIVRDINTVNNFCGAYQGINFIRFISGGYSAHVTNRYEMDNLGNFSFFWNGLGRIYITSSLNPDAQIYADDLLMITGPDGSISHQFSDWSAVHPSPALDITSILNPCDLNSIQVEVCDIFGAYIGCSTLILVQSNSALNQPKNINTTEIIQLCADVAGSALITAAVIGAVITAPAWAVGGAAVLGVALCAYGAGVFDDWTNPNAWIKAGISIGTSLIPAYSAVKGLTFISKASTIIMKDSVIFTGGQYVAKNSLIGGSYSQVTKNMLGAFGISYSMNMFLGGLLGN
ncbi:MAG: chitobiase/beta-hexosaminidase C-terminal domain-containing protein, partial [Methanobacteriaceae archaeon]|nr:chitobiase/beta-hexosaminidase C-terminal domain-containing protein [Methanobacteriaceae archaeon]